MKTILAAMQRGLSSTLLIIVLVLSMTTAARAQSGSGSTDGGTTSGGALSEQIVPAGGGAAVPGGPGFVSVSGLDFRPYVPSLNYGFTGTTLYNKETISKYYIATFNIPNGATINKMVVYYQDSDAVEDFSLDLIQIPLSYTYSNLMATFSSSGSLDGNTYGQTTSILYPLVDLSRYAYGLQVDLPPSTNVHLIGVRIDYGYPNSLPVIVNTTP